MGGLETSDDDARIHTARRVRPGIVVVFTGARAGLTVVPFSADGVELGRDLLGVEDSKLSRRHAHVAWRAGRWYVRDLASRNGSWLGNRELREGEQTAVGEAVLRIGHTVLLLVEDISPFEDPPVDDDRAVPWIGPRMRSVVAAIERAARDSDTLLITGPSGTGKEHLAARYHAASGRSGRFVGVNCGAIPEALAERVLFGARRGVYTGADADADGYFVAADRGTIFLDELAELPLALQVKLLRVIEAREVEPLGATKPRSVDVKIVAATHQDLRAMVADGKFRQDLYFRLASPTVRVPALSERLEDVPILMARARDSIEPKLALSAALVGEACLRPWPGNVRELLKAIAAAAAVARDEGGTEIAVTHLDDAAGRPFDATRRVEPTAEELRAAVEENGGNLASAARALGLHRTQLYRLLDRHGLRSK